MNTDGCWMMYCLTDTEVTEVTGRNVSADVVLAGLGFNVLLRYIKIWVFPKMMVTPNHPF